MLGEMLHQAKRSGDELVPGFVLLKLDVIKAFDRLEWPFILALLDKSGFTGSLTSFVKASFANASSKVCLNGRMIESILLICSVRQGCPLSRLVFIMAYNVLGACFQDALNRQSIEGVHFPSLGIQALQNMFADDLYLIIWPILRYILELQRILHILGTALGLFGAWNKTHASPIPAGPPPMELWMMSWIWEDDSNATPLLGPPVKQSFSTDRVENALMSKLEGRIAKLRNRQLALAARIIVANALLLGSLWYLIVVWAGKRSFLAKLQRVIDCFVWTG